MPVTMETFYKHVKASSERCARRLEEEWLQECCELIDNLRDSIEEWMPQDDQVSTMYVKKKRSDVLNEIANEWKRSC